jgi:hypothetical protein
MAGGDDWTAWLAGTYTPAPTPTPTVTVTPAPEIIERVVTVSGSTNTVIQYVPEVKSEPVTKKEIRAEIKRLKKEMSRLNKKLKRLVAISKPTP